MGLMSKLKFLQSQNNIVNRANKINPQCQFVYSNHPSFCKFYLVLFVFYKRDFVTSKKMFSTAKRYMKELQNKPDGVTILQYIWIQTYH